MNNLIVEKPTPEQVKALREKAGLSQGDFAKLIGVSNRQLIGDYENGNKTPNAQTWTMALLATNEHPNFSITPKSNKEFNMIIDTKSKKIDISAMFIDAPFTINEHKIECGINLSVGSKDFICIVEKTNGFKLVKFPNEISEYLADFYNLEDFGGEDEHYAEDYLYEKKNEDLCAIKKLVLDKGKEIINNYLETTH